MARKTCPQGAPATTICQGRLSNLVTVGRTRSGLLRRYEDYNTTVCQAARAEGSECLDVVPELQRPGIQLTVSKIDTHPSVAVYARISERVAEMLEAPQRVNLQ